MPMPDLLIIDDEPLIRDLLSALFVKEGRTVAVAANGEEGLRQFARERARLVIVDILMPVKEGVETIMELRRLDPDLKIVAISGGGRRSTLDFLDVAEKLGADETLAKPFTRARIVQVVNRYLSPAPDASGKSAGA